ncbi:MAG: hypothetical protein FJ109_14155 [Deltaproteobacteria bacterium]|nr:hypothetical protein [Deltaproteobacteria bacterium]
MTATTKNGDTVKIPVWFITLLVTVVMALTAWAVSVERRLTENATDVRHLTKLVEEIHQRVVK